MESFGKFGRVIDELSGLRNRKQIKNALRNVYTRLVQGETYDWSHEDLFNVASFMKEYGLKDEAEELFMAISSVVRGDPVEDYNMLSLDMPGYFNDKVENRHILGDEEQKKLKNSSKDVVFDRLFDHFASYGIDILPCYASPAMRELEAELLQAMQTYEYVNENSLPKLRKKLGQKTGLMELEHVGDDFYTQTKRRNGDEGPTGKIEFKVKKIEKADGPRFMVTRVGGYHGILRYYIEEIGRIAPDGANAFLSGTGILKSVECNGMWSPVVAGTVIRPINQRDGQYHIVPVKFFHVEADNRKKYVLGVEESDIGDDGKPHFFREVVRPKGSSKVVSRSKRGLVVS